jgi:DNA-binding IclR family transcriptional regulator
MELFYLGAKARRFAVRNLYHGLLESAASQTGDTAFLIMRLGHDCICVDRVVGSYPIRTLTVDIGTQRPLGIGSGSLAFLAFLPDDEKERILAANAVRYLHYGVNESALRALAAEGRAKGYVASLCLFHEAVNSVGIPLFDEKSEVEAAVSVAGIPQRMNSQRLVHIAGLLARLYREKAVARRAGGDLDKGGEKPNRKAGVR